MRAGSHNVIFSYDGNGLMTQKYINGGSTTYDYVYEDGRLIRQKLNGSLQLEFLYGKEGLIGFIYNQATYLYQKNVFGDIVKIVDNTGAVVGEYSYTAFGECTVLTDLNNIANINPFRYRGYFYESNSGLYYLKTRFYNPVTGRFISPDDTKYLQPDVINGLNLFAYCGNNPVMNIDDNGCYPVSTSQVMGYLVSSMEFVGKGFLGVLKHWTKNDVRPNNIGVGLFNKQQYAKLNSLNRAGKLFNKGVAIAQYVVLAVGVFEGVKSDKANGLSNGRIAANAIVNSAIAVGSYVLAGAVGAKVGAIVGSFIPVPIVGSIVGTVIGSLIGVGIDYVLNSSIGNKVVTEIKDFVYDVGETIVDFGQTIGRGLEKVWDWIF